MSAEDLPVVILTGLSGAGKTTALRVFEDLGFYCVDGLPTTLMGDLFPLFDTEQMRRYEGLALGLDMRQLEIGEDAQNMLLRHARDHKATQIIFLEASTHELLRRYASSRRPHPLESRRLGLEQAVEQERLIMTSIRDAADLVIDTTHFSLHDLRRRLQEKWTAMEGKEGALKVHIMSFGFKYGLPSESDLVFDLRFLPNPYFDEGLRPFTGKDAVISDFVLGSDPGKTFLERLTDFLLMLLPMYAQEGRYRLTLGCGCTGGRHRSVAVAEALFDRVQAAGYSVSLEHRNIEQG